MRLSVGFSVAKPDGFTTSTAVAGIAAIVVALFAVYPAENWSIRAPGNGEDQRLGCALTTEVGVEAPPQLGRINVDYIVLAAI